jgi:pyruvate formate lyase activating enzyme
MHEILITNIQRFSLHDGPGIRTTVFLKGCSLRCPWCSNPENQLPVIQNYFKDSQFGVYGKWYEPDNLVKECLKDKSFYYGKLPRTQWNINNASLLDSLPGGITLSGGEALLQMKQLVPVCEKLHASNIHIAVETCLFVPLPNITLALSNIDLFFVDVKILDSEDCSASEQGNLDLYLKNFDVIMQSNKPVIIRVPVIGQYTDGEENRQEVKKLLGKYRNRILKIELIKEHNLGETKYKSLGMQVTYHGVSNELLETYRNELLDLEIPVEICKI